MSTPDEEELAYRLKRALRSYGVTKKNSKNKVFQTCVVNGIYISNRDCRVRAHVYATEGKSWANGGTGFTLIFQEDDWGEIWSLTSAVDYYLPILRKAQILDTLADI